MLACTLEVAGVEAPPHSLNQRGERGIFVQRLRHERFEVGSCGPVHPGNAHVAAERDRAKRVFDPVVPHFLDRGREADVECARSHTDEQRNREVAELMHEDEQQQPDDHDYPDHATRIARAARSASTRSARSRAGEPSAHAMASPTASAISRNGSRPSRNAATATSFAALNTHGYVPPFSPASRASASIGNVSVSGASKTSVSDVRSSGERGTAARSGYVSEKEIG